MSDVPSPPPASPDPFGPEQGGNAAPPPPPPPPGGGYVPPPPPPGGGYTSPPPPPGGGYTPPPSYGQGAWPSPPSGYGAPQSSPLAPFGQPLAEWWQRLVAYIIDSILIGIVAGIFEAAASGNIVFLFIGNGILGFLYFGLMLGQPSGQTLGMMVMKIRVRDAASGAPLDSGRAFGRAAVQHLPVVVPFLGGLWELVDDLWPLWDPMRQALHDKAVNTVVVSG